jgi:hypothetical protein
MVYPPAVQHKAQRLEQLLLRVEAGETFAHVAAELGLTIPSDRLSHLQAKYEAGGRQWAALLDGRYGHYQQVNSAVRAYLFERKQQDEGLTAGQLASEVEHKFAVKVSAGHVNHVLRTVALTRPPGRPRKGSVGQSVGADQEIEAPLANAGLFFPGGRQTSHGGGGGGGSLSE